MIVLLTPYKARCVSWSNFHFIKSGCNKHHYIEENCMIKNKVGECDVIKREEGKKRNQKFTQLNKLPLYTHTSA